MGREPAHRVVLVDDDHWTRSAMSTALDGHRGIRVVGVAGQDEALGWGSERWVDVDTALVDVFDLRAPSEVGTDVFSGIAVLDALRDLPVRTLAVTPYCQHPLVQLRIQQAGADALYHRWEVNDLHHLAAAILHPCEAHRPGPPSAADLRDLGATGARPNEAVRVYEASPLHGRLRNDIGLKHLRLPRRTTDRFRRQVASTGFAGTEQLSFHRSATRIPRWPDVRDFVLAAVGRRDVPATEVDRDDVGPSHPPVTPPPPG